jgi:hypothetical protein
LNGCPPGRRLHLALVLLVFSLLLLAPPSLGAQSPPAETRPHLELPWPGGTTYRLTCGYGCYQHQRNMTYAVDIGIPEGDPIVAAADGQVVAITWETGLPTNLNLGDALIMYIDHGNGWFTRYIHMSGVTIYVGDWVRRGQVIAYSGKTGASGAHLHFELKYGSSLYSPSVPINELFGGMEPVAGRLYTSSNYHLPDEPATLIPLPTPADVIPYVGEQILPEQSVEQPAPVTHEVLQEAPATATAPPASYAAAVQPLVAPEFQDRIPQLDADLALSTPTVVVGDPVTVTFALRNDTGERLHLAALGVAGRGESREPPARGTLLFDRTIILNPGRSYEFSRQHVFSEAGERELFVFALSPQNEWVPVNGTGQTLRVSVEPVENTVFLPLVLSGDDVEESVDPADEATLAPLDDESPAPADSPDQE